MLLLHAVQSGPRLSILFFFFFAARACHPEEHSPLDQCENVRDLWAREGVAVCEEKEERRCSQVGSQGEMDALKTVVALTPLSISHMGYGQ